MDEHADWLSYDYERMLVDPIGDVHLPPIGRETGLTRANLQGLDSQLQAARQEVLRDLELLDRDGKIPPEKVPLDARFVDLPSRLLDELAAKGERSELAEIRRVADRLAAAVDRVVVLGIGGSYMGARAIFEALCHPYHNERSRTERGHRPRLYFEGNNVDNDAVRGLIELLAGKESSDSAGDSWGVIVISKSGETLETGVAFRVFLERLRESCRDNPARLSERIVAVTSRGSGLWKLAKSLGVPDDQLFAYPDHLGGRYSVLSAVGLLPAAVLGLDVQRMLEGARAMTERFQDPDSGDRIVLDYVAVAHLMEVWRGLTIRILSTWGKRLEALGLWYDQLFAESLGKHGRGATPLVVVNTRDLHSRGQQHQEGRRDKLFTNLIVDEPGEAPVVVPRLPSDEDDLNRLAAERTLPEILEAAFVATNEAYADDFRRTADIHLPKLDEYHLGQLFQMLMLSTVVEGRLIGINPYGQPGVQAYKLHMERILLHKRRLPPAETIVITPPRS